MDHTDYFLATDVKIWVSTDFRGINTVHFRECLFSCKCYAPITQLRIIESQWPRGLRHQRHQLSSPARTLESCFRIPLEAWMSVHVHSVFVLSCVDSGIATDWSLVQGALPAVYKIT
jgi:hypothetical protein